MVYYGQRLHPAQPPPPVCPKCGSHRTQIVGRSNDARTVVVRCSACGERSSLIVADNPDSEPSSQLDGELIEMIAG
jgi:hypothetical protein